MKKGLKIVGFLVLLTAFAACEKCDKPVFNEDPFENASNRAPEKEGYSASNRDGGDLPVISGDVHGGGDVSDPNEEDGFDGIVDPDEDEDFGKDK